MKFSRNTLRFFAALMTVCIVLNVIMMFANIATHNYTVAAMNVVAMVFCWLGIPVQDEPPSQDERWYK